MDFLHVGLGYVIRKIKQEKSQHLSSVNPEFNPKLIVPFTQYTCIPALLTQPFPIQQILDPSKLNEFFQTTIFKFDENGSKSSKRVENTVGKGEIAHHEQFLLFPQCFQKTCTADT